MSTGTGFWWWGSSSGGAPAEFDRLLEACTSSNLPSSTPPPITDSLSLSDLIRSSAVTSAHAIKSLQKRLDHSNPNVQLLAISVIDICVKNGGDAFLKEVGSREFSEDCAQIISSPLSNREVKEKLKREFQNWALAFEAVPFLANSDLVANYRRLKTIGTEFPPKDPSATAAMVDSMSAPEWRDSDVCERCRTAFSFTNRKHHCRNCGGVFDGQCSSKKRALPHYGVTELVRICDGCDRNLTSGLSTNPKPGPGPGRRNSFSGESSQPSPSKLSAGQSNHHRSATIHSGSPARGSYRVPTSATGQTKLSTSSNRISREEADLERAIALSLQDSAPSQRASTFSHSTPITASQFLGAPSRPPVSSVQDECADPDLAAAIAASLRDIPPPPNAEPSAPISASPSRSTGSYRHKPPLPSFDLSAEHTNTLLNFSADVESAGRTGQLFPTHTDLSHKHAQAEMARPYLNRGIENAERKTQMLKEMNDKLSQAVKMYDRLLGEQIMYRTQPPLNPDTNVPPALNYHGQMSYNHMHTSHAPPVENGAPYQRDPNQFFMQQYGPPYPPQSYPATYADQALRSGPMLSADPDRAPVVASHFNPHDAEGHALPLYQADRLHGQQDYSQAVRQISTAELQPAGQQLYYSQEHQTARMLNSQTPTPNSNPVAYNPPSQQSGLQTPYSSEMMAPTASAISQTPTPNSNPVVHNPLSQQSAFQTPYSLEMMAPTVPTIEAARPGEPSTMLPQAILSNESHLPPSSLTSARAPEPVPSPSGLESQTTFTPQPPSWLGSSSQALGPEHSPQAVHPVAGSSGPSLAAEQRWTQHHSSVQDSSSPNVRYAGPDAQPHHRPLSTHPAAPEPQVAHQSRPLSLHSFVPPAPSPRPQAASGAGLTAHADVAAVYLPSVPQTPLGPEPGLPTFPSVPTGQVVWHHGPAPQREWEAAGLGQTRQEEVAPLIEL